MVFLEERFTDWLSNRQIAELTELDTGAAGGSSISSTIRSRLAAPPLHGTERDSTITTAHAVGLTPSQESALGSVLDHDVELIWGPPGTGKTHFLATTVLSMMEAHRAAGTRSGFC